LTRAAFLPSDNANRIATTHNVTFHSDSPPGTNLIHCFPISGTSTMVLSNNDFEVVKNAMARRNELLTASTAGAATGAANALYAARNTQSVQDFFTSTTLNINTVVTGLRSLARERQLLDTMSHGLKGLFG
jgi:hypothetical protein